MYGHNDSSYFGFVVVKVVAVIKVIDVVIATFVAKVAVNDIAVSM